MMPNSYIFMFNNLYVFRYHDEQFFQRGKRTFLLKNCVDYAYKLKSPPVQSDGKYVYLEYKALQILRPVQIEMFTG